MTLSSKKMTKFTATGASAALVATALVPAASADEVKTAAFTDVAPQYQEAVDFIVAQNIAKGKTDTQFGIHEEIIRGDAGIMIAQAAGLMEEDAPASGFTDVPTRGALAINSLKAAGVTNGKSATQFDFHGSITRGEAAIFIADAFGLSGDTDNVEFTDVSDRYMESVAALVDHGITQGKTATQFATHDEITRGEFAVWLHALEDMIVGEEPVDPDTDAPVLSYDGDTEIEIGFGETLNWPEVGVDDETVDVDLVITDEDGNVVEEDDFDTDTAGTYTFTYTAVDAAGNEATPVEVTVVVEEQVNDAVEAEEAAEAAILDLPAVEDLTLEDAETVAEVRALVDAALELNEDADIDGLDILVSSEETIAALEAEAELTAAIEAAIAAIDDIPETVDMENRDAVLDARAAVEAVLALDEDADIDGLDVLVAAEAELADIAADAVEDEATGLSTSSFQIALEPGIEGLTAEDFGLYLEAGENSANLVFDVESNEDGTVYTFTHVDLDGGVGEINVNLWGETVAVSEFNYSAEAIDTAVANVTAAVEDIDNPEAPTDDELDALLAALEAPVLNFIGTVNPNLVTEYAAEFDASVINTYDRLLAAIERVNAEYDTSIEEMIADLNAATGIEGDAGIVTILGNLDIENLLDDEDVEIAYFDEIQAQQPQTVEEVQNLIDDVNLAEVTATVDAAVANPADTDFDEVGLLVTAYGDNGADADLITEFEASLELGEAVQGVLTADADTLDDELETLAGLSDDIDLDTFNAEYTAEYLTDLDDDDVTTAADIQAVITDVNEASEAVLITAINEATTEADLDEALADIGIDESTETQQTLFLSVYGDTAFNTIEEIEEAYADVQLIAAVNAAGDSAETSDALLDIDNESFINLGSTSREEVAQLFFANDYDDFAAQDDINAELETVIDQYTALLGGINEAETIAEMDDALEALDAEFDLGYDDLDDTDQLTVAEQLLGNFPVDSDGNEVNFTTFGSVLDAITDNEEAAA
ncbi:S-layer homology domain-containing protein [Planococcus salinus]|uniref:SLH domain-containing protein n=1 Tax=Planococcus salinus TaxID=1848460 RepID=A0A3M8P4H5_9BACL|nr:S-layer homology domain-containing protein [Planococcus salinus]RNF38260.1 hypothetical protein EEX84_15475 [Planococcus salinus]